jgi:hypothetical protein
LSKPFFRDLNAKTNLNSLPIFSETQYLILYY